MLGSIIGNLGMRLNAIAAKLRGRIVLALHAVENWLGAFGQDTKGAIVVQFALAMIPVTLAVGAAVDYSSANKARTQLNVAADTAALAAVNKVSMGKAASAAQTTALNMFNAYAATVNSATLKKVSATVTDAGMNRTAVVTYTASYRTMFMGMMGIPSITIGGTSTGASALPTYLDFYLLLDNTPSMGVGATTDDINTMVANTPDKCAFACHDLSASPNDYYGLAKNLGVQMRIDVVRQATQKLMDTATATQAVTGQFRVAIYTFGASASNPGLTKIQSLTTNLSTAKSSASSIDLMTVPYQNYASDTDTDLPDVLTDMNSEIATPGDGSTSSLPQKIMFFVSDGVSDRASTSPACSKTTTSGTDPQTGKKYTRCQEPLITSYCDTMKKRGVKIAVLYTTYLPLPTNGWYNSWISPFQNQIATNMQTCASPGLYFEVSPTQGISQAMTALFQKAVQEARLTK